jgi:hypothetical protein
VSRDKDFSAVSHPDSTVLGSPHHYYHVAADLTLFRQEVGRKSQALIVYPCGPHLHGDVGIIPRLIGCFSAAPTHRVSKNVAFSEDEGILVLGCCEDLDMNRCDQRCQPGQFVRPISQDITDRQARTTWVNMYPCKY